MSTTHTIGRSSSTNRRRALRGAAQAVVGAATAIAIAIAIAGPASAASSARTVQVGPGIGVQCVSAYATYQADGSGFATSPGGAATFQMRYFGQQVVGTGQQVTAYSATVRPGLPGWSGPGYYEFCARNNGSFATVYLSINTM